MAKKITPEQIKEMRELYAELGTYAAVAKKMGISNATVSRYIKQFSSEKTYAQSDDAVPIENILPFSIISFSRLTEQEQTSYKEWLEEFV